MQLNKYVLIKTASWRELQHRKKTKKSKNMKQDKRNISDSDDISGDDVIASDTDCVDWSGVI